MPEIKESSPFYASFNFKNRIKVMFLNSYYLTAKLGVFPFTSKQALFFFWTKLK